jgi:DNA-binding transcriptional ArsR family regulator
MVTQEKQKLYEKQAEVVKGFAHALRIAILDFVKDGEKCVCDIAEQVGAEQSNVSRHLALMVSSGVLVSRKQGLKVLYRVKTPCVLEFLGCVNRCLVEQAQEHEHILKQL